MSYIGRWYRRLCRFISTDRAFQLLIAFFVIEAAWIALSGRYPMAFDEDFHVGVIKLYAHHLLPFWGSQPAGADAYGAVARDPSYLFQYIFGFLYRLLELFTNSQTAIVIVLRFCNIALAVSGLWLFRKLLLRTGAETAVVHAAFALLVLIPILPLLAAQINYDNLLMPLTALTLLLADEVRVRWQQRQAWPIGVLMLVSCLFAASLVKYAFLPVVLGVVLYLGWFLVCNRLLVRPLLKSAATDVAGGYRSVRLAGAVLLVMVLGVLWVERYGLNLAYYHTPIPSCDQVLSVDHCRAYGPWNRNYTLQQTVAEKRRNPVAYMNEWLYGMWLRTFFSVDGPASDFETRGPLLLPGLAGAILPVLLGAAALFGYRNIMRRYNRRLFALLLLAATLYVITLWLTGYQDYVSTGQPVAINGRYLLPVLPPLLLFGLLSLRSLLARYRGVFAALLMVSFISFVIGGGVLTYVLRSGDYWLWPNQTVRTVNRAVRQTIGQTIPGYSRPTEFLR